uniref:Ig-like domain-containing protein n=1 Tax=Cyprinus carpio TaxID=7962 RepID=A0A8C1Y5P5_CYPCA
MSVMEGDSVSLNTGVTEVQNYHMIQWMFGEIQIAEINNLTKINSIYDTDDDKTLKNRLKLDPQTGSLTITNTRTTDSGLYQLRLTSGETRSKSFRVTVSVFTALLPVPVISRNSSQCSSSSSSSSPEQSCSLLCSVVNVSAVSVSWFRGNGLLSSISVSDHSISLSLPLEVEYQDKNSYSCVLNNSFTNQTTHLDIRGLCQPCADHFHCCNPTEAVIRLAFSALVGVAALAVLVYDFRSRKAKQDTKDHISP